MSALPVLEFSATTLNTPTGQQNVVVILSQEPERLHTFGINISFSTDEVATRLMQVHTLRTALANPGQLIDEGRTTVMADPAHNTVIMYLPAGNGNYAVLYLDMQVTQSFVDNVTVEMNSEWSLGQDANMVTERALNEVANEGFIELCKWLVRQ